MEKRQTTDTVVGGIHIPGIRYQRQRDFFKGNDKEARRKPPSRQKFPWNVTITYNGESVDADNLIDTELDAFLDGISADKNGRGRIYIRGGRF